MYPNKGRLLRKSAVRDGGVVGGGYGSVSKGSMVRARKGAAEEGAAFGRSVLAAESKGA